MIVCITQRQRESVCVQITHTLTKARTEARRGAQLSGFALGKIDLETEHRNRVEIKLLCKHI